jgi:hypothetical protein
VEVAREDEGDGERCSGLARRSGSGSDSLSEGCSCRSFRDSLIVAWSGCRRTAQIHNWCKLLDFAMSAKQGSQMRTLWA